MTTLAGNTVGVMPSLLSLASRIRREVTKESLTSLNDDPINNVIVDAVNDSVEDIYYRNRWNWAKVIWNLVWVAAQSEYALPGDFQRLSTEPVINNMMLKEVSPEEWWRNTYSPSWNSNSSLQGQPSSYMVDRSTIKFWPIPSTSFVDANATSPILYYRHPSARLTLTDGASSPDLPVEFTEAVVRYAVARLKIFLQWSDFALDMDRYEKIIQNRIQTDMISAHPVRMRPRNWKTANFG